MSLLGVCIFTIVYVLDKMFSVAVEGTECESEIYVAGGACGPLGDTPDL